ncbi:MAG TPA: hypothetical protein VFM99_04775 [Chitinophagales bacterium]|nr:hypothetical protein [Chitinophagales bacterium]
MTDYIGTGISNFKELIQFLDTRAKSKDLVSNNLLREVRDNLLLLEHRNNAGVDKKELTNALEVKAIDAAFEKNFHFNQLVNNKKLSTEHLIDSQQTKYLGWDAKRFIYSIEGKIKELKKLFAIYPDMTNAPVNITQRYNNLFNQLLQFSAFIYSIRK